MRDFTKCSWCEHEKSGAFCKKGHKTINEKEDCIVWGPPFKNAECPDFKLASIAQ